MTITGAQAMEAMFTHHRSMDERLGGLVEALTKAVAASEPYEAAMASMVAYLAEEVLPHAEAEERTIYVAGALGELAPTVTEMIGEHRELSAAIDRLAGAADGPTAAHQAEVIGAMFGAHVQKENLTLLPALLDQPGVDLPELLKDMHHRTEEAREAAQASDAADADPQRLVLSLLLEAALDLARSGQAERACRLTASAWAALHGTRPDLAARITSVLHRLARMASSELVIIDSDGAGAQASDPDLDVRKLAPAQRHETIFAAYHALAPGAGFVLVNDHDPKPLRYQFEAEHAGEFTWDYQEAGPKVWRVRIGRVHAA